MADHIEENNVGTIDKEELRKAIAIVKSEDEAGHEHNIDNMIQEDDYKSPWNEFKNVNPVSSNVLVPVVESVASLFFQGDL